MEQHRVRRCNMTRRESREFNLGTEELTIAVAHASDSAIISDLGVVGPVEVNFVSFVKAKPRRVLVSNLIVDRTSIWKV